MKIYKLDTDVNNFEWLQPIPPLTYDEMHAFNGNSLKKKWKPIKVKKMEPDRDQPKIRPLGDHPEFVITAISKKAKEVLDDLICDEVEFLGLDCDEGRYYAVNITNVLNAIDRNKSEYKTFRDGKRIMYFIKYSFINNKKLSNSHIFKITDELYGNHPFVSETFKKRVEENGLEGFVFEEVWDSENN